MFSLIICLFINYFFFFFFIIIIINSKVPIQDQIDVLIENAKRNAHKIPAAGKGKQSRDDFSSLSKELKYILTATELLNEDIVEVFEEEIQARYENRLFGGRVDPLRELLEGRSSQSFFKDSTISAALSVSIKSYIVGAIVKKFVPHAECN